MVISVDPTLATVERPKPRKMSPMPQIAKLTAIKPSTTPMTALPSQLLEALRIPRSIEVLHQEVDAIGRHNRRFPARARIIGMTALRRNKRHLRRVAPPRGFAKCANA